MPGNLPHHLEPELAAGRPRTYAGVDFDIVTRHAWHAYSFMPDGETVVLARPVAREDEPPRIIIAPDFTAELADSE